jgi:hypothetical protein
MTAGSFAAVISNLGTDQSQLRLLLQEPSIAKRRSLLLRNLSNRALVFSILHIVMLIYASASLGQPRSMICAIVYFTWAGLIGMQPNAYADYLQAQGRQQAVTFVERIGACLAVAALWVTFDDTGMNSALSTGFALLLTRLAASASQWHFLSRADGHASKMTVSAHTETARTASDHQFSPTLAAIFNSCTAYFPVLLLDYFGQRAGLALYSVTLQAANVVTLFQGMASRRISVRIAAPTAPYRSNDFLRLVLQPALLVLVISCLIAVPGAAVTAWYLIATGRFGPDSSILALVSILFSWGAWLGFGQVMTRALVIHGQSRAYAAATAVTAVASALAGWIFVQSYGIVGSALAIAVPHSTMICFCAIHLYRTMNEGKAL